MQAICNFVVAHKFTGKTFRVNQRNWHSLQHGSYLNCVYGDPRFVVNTITQDISKFRLLQEGEDPRFCDQAHLVYRSFNTLKEIGRPHDMDNNHMLALIEPRMCTNDIKVWAWHIEDSRQQATPAQLIPWMMTERKSRMRETPPLRSVTEPPMLLVSHVGTAETNTPRVYRCKLCRIKNIGSTNPGGLHP